MTKTILLLFLFCFSIAQCVAQGSLPPVYEIKTDTALTQYLDNNYWQILEDQDGKWTIEQVTKMPLADKFHKRGIIMNGADTMVHTYWIRYRLKNEMNRESKICLEQWSDYVDFYVLHNQGKWKHFITGNLVAWEKKDGFKVWNRIPVILQPAEELLVYERINNRSLGLPNQSYFSITFSNTEKRIQTDYIDRVEYRTNYGKLDMLPMFLAGILLLAIFYNLFFFRITREPEYLYFSLFLFFIGTARLTGPLFTYAFWYNRSLLTNSVYLYTAYPLLQFFLVQFTRHFFKTYNTHPRWDKLLFVAGALAAGIFILFMFFNPAFIDGPNNSVKKFLSDLLSTIVYFLLLITLFLYNKKNNRFGILVIVGGLPFILLRSLGSIPLFANLADRLGLTFEGLLSVEVPCLIWFVMIFSLILFMRFNQLRKDNAQQALDKERLEKEKETQRSQLIEQQKAELEKTVEERTLELNHSLDELKSTQSQLIHSEKMASLGELTAGIAHEIQNPLNFVNNFSEVNKELIDEMQVELKAGNNKEAIEISNDIKDNQEKINHHGKRADAIVKGMLQHSRSSSGVKEPTDINALADEYLRLSYHGFRAKDKSFNSTMQTDFDRNIEKINVIPQDIGRVLLNLYNNAFYAVTEKKKQQAENYEPTVSVSSKKINDKIEIRVADNGNSIPQKVLDKIFQPFFTTKPTGQGTGLGLSLSYDIIKAHGGEIKVETKEGEGAEFIIELPINKVNF